MGLVHIEGTIAIIVEFVPNFLNHGVNDVVNIFVVFLALGFFLGFLELRLLLLLQLVVFFGDGHGCCH